MNPTNKPLALDLGGKRYHAYFDLNTFDKFEEITGKHFLEFLASMQEALAAAVGSRTKGEDNPDAMQFLRKLSIRDLRAFIYAALHEYDSRDEPVWTLTIGQMGRLITTSNVVQLASLVMRGNNENSPSAEDAGPLLTRESADRPILAGEPNAPAGGPEFGPSDEVVLGSLTPRSDV